MTVLEGLKEGFARMHTRTLQARKGKPTATDHNASRHTDPVGFTGTRPLPDVGQSWHAEGAPAASPEKLTRTEAFLAGGAARAVAAAVTCPVTVVKTRMEYTGGGGVKYTVSVPPLTREGL